MKQVSDYNPHVVAEFAQLRTASVTWGYASVSLFASQRHTNHSRCVPYPRHIAKMLRFTPRRTAVRCANEEPWALWRGLHAIQVTRRFRWYAPIPSVETSLSSTILAALAARADLTPFWRRGAGQHCGVLLVQRVY